MKKSDLVLRLNGLAERQITRLHRSSDKIRSKKGFNNRSKNRDHYEILK